jgi:outer membrane protein
MTRISTALCLAALACAPALAQAQRSTIDLGVAYNYFGDTLVNGPTGGGAPALAAMDVSHVTAVMLNYEYRPTANLGLQLATSFGGTLNVDGAGSLAAQGRLFKARPYSATAFLNYHFFDEGNALRPFLGIGANFTGYSSVESYTGQAVDMSNGWSAAVQAGARYAFDSRWSLRVSLGMNWAKSDITLVGASGTQQASIEFRPVVFGLAVGYSF